MKFQIQNLIKRLPTSFSKFCSSPLQNILKNNALERLKFLGYNLASCYINQLHKIKRSAYDTKLIFIWVYRGNNPSSFMSKMQFTLISYSFLKTYTVRPPPAMFSCFHSSPAVDAALGHWLHTATADPAFDFHVFDVEPFSHFSASFLLE